MIVDVKKLDRDISIGDIVEYNSTPHLVVYESFNDYHYLLVNLYTCKVTNSFEYSRLSEVCVKLVDYRDVMLTVVQSTGLD